MGTGSAFQLRILMGDRILTFAAVSRLFTDYHGLQHFEISQAQHSQHFRYHCLPRGSLCMAKSRARSCRSSFSSVCSRNTGSSWQRACPILLMLCSLGTTSFFGSSGSSADGSKKALMREDESRKY